jgi:hypothetical protein
LATRGLQLRLFLTCWLLYSVHHATDFVREHYLVVSIVEDRSFDLSKYLGLHVDIFQNPPTAPHGGAHHGANPGVSMLAAIPYFALKPAVDWVVARERSGRDPADTVAVYRDETRPRRLAFYEATRRMGLDVRFGLVALITTVLCMAPLTAASVVAVFRILGGVGVGTRTAAGLSLVYAFTTPVFFRASYLNQNLAVAIFTIFGLLLLWDPGGTLRWRAPAREAVAGFLGGFSLLSDYSGGLTLGFLGLYLLVRRYREASSPEAVRSAVRFTLGAVGPILLLWFYQWQSFGHPFYPPQHWMAPVEWIDIGYQGVGGPRPDLFGLLLFDPRYGLFPSAPLLLLALAAPFLRARSAPVIPRRELVFCYALALAYLLFFSAVQYTRLQWVTGIRYLLPVIPLLFLPVAMALLRLPRVISYGAVVVSFIVTWSMTLVRSQTGVLDAVVRTMLEGVRLPAITTLSRMSTQYAPWLDGYASSWPLLAVVAAVLVAIWWMPNPWQPLVGQPHAQPVGPDARSMP